MAKKSVREEAYGKYVWRRTRNGREEIFARVGYYDENGKWKYKTEKANDEDDAIDRANKIIEAHEKAGIAYIDGSNMTFEALADWYKKNYVFAATYEEGQQSSGLRTHQNITWQVDRLKLEFGKRKINTFNEDVLKKFKNKRKNVDQVKTATVNRDLQLLRTMFNKAVIKRWLDESPFLRTEKLIQTSLEVRRNKTVTPAEEKLILEETRALSNKYVYPLILALRDSGARPSELFPYKAFGVDMNALPEKIQTWMTNGINSKEQVYLPLCWFKLFEFNFEVMPLASLKSQQVEFRYSTMTGRLRQALLDLWETTDKDPIQLVFPFKTIKKEWGKIREKTQIPDLRIRDWRRIWASTAHEAGISDHVKQRMLGHKQMQTSYHYTEADLRAVVESGRRIDEQQLVSEANN